MTRPHYLIADEKKTTQKNRLAHTNMEQRDQKNIIAPDGILLLDKPAGRTSHDCVNEIRRLYGTKKVGHAGTLDPMATGLLVVLLGRAAKASDCMTEKDKHYQAILQLGLTTDTQDITGRVLSKSTAPLPDEQTVKDTAALFCGAQQQIPPMYSALKIHGKKLVDLARQQITVERQPRDIFVYALTVVPVSDGAYDMQVHCSKGTYIRTLCADIGEKLGCGGVMASLRRTQSGLFSIRDAITLDALAQMTMEERLRQLRPVETLFSDLPIIRLPAFYDRLAKNGCEIYLHKLRGVSLQMPKSAGEQMPVVLQALPVGTRVRLYDENGFWALGEVQQCVPQANNQACHTTPNDRTSAQKTVRQPDGQAQSAIRAIKRFVLP